MKEQFALMTIRSLQSIGGIPFGAERSALSGLGKPLREVRKGCGEEELWFEGSVYRFVAGKLVEVSFELRSFIEINGQRIPSASLVEFLKMNDPEFREVYGFAVAPNLGLAADLDHEDHWATAFSAGRWDDIK
jgi:hypothetical protein